MYSWWWPLLRLFTGNLIIFGQLIWKSGADGTKQLPELMLTTHLYGFAAFIRGQFDRKCSRYRSLIWAWKLIISYYKGISQEKNELTHWGRVTHICVSNQIIIGSDNGLSPGRRQAIIWTNAGILLIRTLGTNSSDFLSEIRAFSLKKMHLKMSSGKWRPSCLGLNVLIRELLTSTKLIESIVTVIYPIAHGVHGHVIARRTPQCWKHHQNIIITVTS